MTATQQYESFPDDEPDDPHLCYRLSEASLRDWLRPEEEEAWAYLQPKQKEEASS